MFDEKYSELYDNIMICEKLSTMSDSKTIAMKINKFFDSQDVMEIDEESLISKIESLSDNAILGLLEALKNREIHRIVNILGMKISKQSISGE